MNRWQGYALVIAGLFALAFLLPIFDARSFRLLPPASHVQYVKEQILLAAVPVAVGLVVAYLLRTRKR